MTKTKLTPCLHFKVKRGEVKCKASEFNGAPFTRPDCPKTLKGLYSVGEKYIPCNKCLFLGRHMNRKTGELIPLRP